MKITGIVCEYDPFHNGHAYLLERAREGSEVVICAMSGNFTQRGSMALVDKYTRAEAALRGGADLVLELPYPFSSTSAEYFATAGVAILASAGVDRICFGSEQGDIVPLERAAELSMTLSRGYGQIGVGTAEGYFDALGAAYFDRYGEHLTVGPNDILGIEYCKAILRGGHEMIPEAVVRRGDGFHAETTGATPFASATALRKQIREQGIDGLEAYMPDSSLALLRGAVERGDAPVDMNRIGSAVLAFFRTVDPQVLCEIAELGNGLEHRLCEVARAAKSMEEFFALTATKKYTDARIRRAVLFAMTGVRREDLLKGVRYTSVFATNKRGCEWLSTLRKRERAIPIVTKPADAAKVDARQYELSFAADSLFTLAMPQPREAGYFVRKSAAIL